jgi:hypothetical protein
MGVILRHVGSDPPATRNENHLSGSKDYQMAMAARRPLSSAGLVDDLTKLVSTALTTAPTQLREAAQATIADIQQGRAARMEEIQATMATFAAQRAAGTVPDETTSLTPTDQQATTVGPKRSRVPMFVVGGIIIIAVIAAILLSTSGGGDSATDTPTPGTQVAASGDEDTPTATHTSRPTATDTPQPTVTGTSRPTITPATPVVEARRNLPIRLGPGPQYPEVDQLESGDTDSGVSVRCRMVSGAVAGWLAGVDIASGSLVDVAAMPMC